MKILSSPFVSRAGGIVLNSSASAAYVDRYAEKHGIDLFDYEDKTYASFNDFFTRKIKPGRRTVDTDENTLVCPSDGKVSAYEIADSDMFVIKNSVYTAESLLRDRKLAKKYAGGSALIIRLTPDDYHRYIYPADGIKSHNRKIKGALNTVRPTVNKYLPVYKENCREYCMIRTERFGDIIQMEIGAMMVGKISNYESECAAVRKGEEKGRFEFGGSTIVILLEKGKAKVCKDLTDATKHGYETKLRQGEAIAFSAVSDQDNK
jgi:phosphatidylserine decarboxylase